MTFIPERNNATEWNDGVILCSPDTIIPLQTAKCNLEWDDGILSSVEEYSVHFNSTNTNLTLILQVESHKQPMSQPTRVHMSSIISERDVSEHAKHTLQRTAASILFQVDVRLVVILLRSRHRAAVCVLPL